MSDATPSEAERNGAPTTAPAAFPPAGRTRRVRSVTESLLSIVLALEAILVFFVMLTAFGLKAVEPVVGFAAGLVLMVLLILAARLLRYGGGIWVGWVLQAALVATGVMLPIMFFIGACFVAIWVYCVVKGHQIDATNTALLSVASTQEKDN